MGKPCCQLELLEIRTRPSCLVSLLRAGGCITGAAAVPSGGRARSSGPLFWRFVFWSAPPKSSLSVGQPADSEAEIAILNAYTDEENELLHSVNKKLKAGSCFAWSLPENLRAQAFSDLVVARSEFLRKKMQAMRSFERASSPAFLALKVMPVDAFKIRNSLYLTVGAAISFRRISA